MPKPIKKRTGTIFGQAKGAEKLKDIKKNLPIKKGRQAYPSVEFFNAPKHNIRVGAKILRPVKFFKPGQPEMEVNIEIPKTGEGSYIFRYDDDHMYFTKYAVIGGPSLKHAQVCFCNYDVPEDWIYFEVKGFGKNGRTAFVEPVAGTLKDLLEYYDYEGGRDK